MKAMILAAGYGTRLRPLTDHTPKALVPVGGVPMLERLIRRMYQCGIHDIIINTHHLAEQIHQFIRSNNAFGIHIEFSHEPEILGTGGGIRQAAHFFNDGRPFLVHNVDILSSVDIHAMLDFHRRQQNIATIAVKKRKTNRYFLVDSNHRVCGHVDYSKGIRRIVTRCNAHLDELAFSGIHVLSPAIFNVMPDTPSFSIIDVYLKLAEQRAVSVYRMDDCYWRDLGKHEQIRQAEADIANQLIE